MDWFYVQNGKKVGPVPVGKFDELVQAGHITPETLVWHEGLANWQPLRSINAAPASVPLRPAPPPVPGALQAVLPASLTGCAECGLEYSESEMIPFGGSWICGKCKPIFFQRVREGAPLAAGGAEAWQSGDAVVTLHGGKLPMRCVRCNGAATGKPIERAFYWTPQWVFILIIIPLIYLIAYLILGKRTRVSVPICEECRQRRRMFIGVTWFLVTLGFGTFLAANIYDAEALGVLALAMLLAAMFLGLSKGMLVATKKVDAQYIWLRGFCPEYRASLPEFPDVR